MLIWNVLFSFILNTNKNWLDWISYQLAICRCCHIPTFNYLIKCLLVGWFWLQLTNCLLYTIMMTTVNTNTTVFKLLPHRQPAIHSIHHIMNHHPMTMMYDGATKYPLIPTSIYLHNLFVCQSKDKQTRVLEASCYRLCMVGMVVRYGMVGWYDEAKWSRRLTVFYSNRCSEQWRDFCSCLLRGKKSSKKQLSEQKKITRRQ